MDSTCEVQESLVKNFNEEFGILTDRAYLDHAGATLYSTSQLAAVRRDLERSVYGNPHTRSPASKTASDAIDQARFRLLQHFHTTSEQYSVVFTSGATAALALVADAFQFNGDPAAPGAFVYVQESHTSVLGMRARMADRAVSVTALPAAEATEVLSNTMEEDASPEDDTEEGAGPEDSARRGLFVYPAQCNFSGVKYPLRWVRAARHGALDGLRCGALVRGPPPKPGCRWYTMLDAASFAATCDLDLGRTQPDFVCLSFYKMFGYPTGLGALLVHRRAEHTLQKAYFGGGTVQVSLAGEDFYVPREALHERLEDGTVAFLSIAAVTHGLDTLRRLTGTMSAVSSHVFSLARYTQRHLSSLHHGNGEPVVRLYADTEYDDPATQGGIIAFNLLRPDGEYFGSTEVEKFAEVYDIDLRTGCFCNPGACQRHLGLSTETVRQHFKAGHVCGDETDLIDGRPTGAVRVSFGYMSRRSDADRLLLMVRQCFVTAAPSPEEAEERLRRAQQRRTEAAVTASETINGDKMPSKAENTHSNTGTAVENGGKVNASSPPPPSPLREAEKTAEHSSAKPHSAQVNGHSKTASEPRTAPRLPTTPTATSPPAGQAVARPITSPETVPGALSGGARLSGLVVFPVKSCCGFSVPWWPLGPRGLLFDRHWMVVSAGGQALTQKRAPTLCRVRPEVCLHTGQLRLTAEGFAPVSVPLWSDPVQSQTPVSMCESRVCGDRVGGLDCGDAAAEWLSEVLDQDGVRLVRQNPASSRAAKLNGSSPGGGGALSLSNESPYVLVNRSSVIALREALQERGVDDGVTEDELTDRFRANLVISGVPAYLEDNMESVTLGNVTLKVLGGCSRCHMIGVDQATGHRSPEPLLTLSATRGRRMPFGVHLGHPTSANATGTDADVGMMPPDNALLTVGQPVVWKLAARETSAEAVPEQ